MALVGSDGRVDLHVPPHVVFRAEHFLTLWTGDVSVSLDVHVLHVLVQVGPIVGGVVALLAVEQLGLVREVRVVVNLRHNRKH